MKNKSIPWIFIYSLFCVIISFLVFVAIAGAQTEDQTVFDYDTDYTKYLESFRPKDTSKTTSIGTAVTPVDVEYKYDLIDVIDENVKVYKKNDNEYVARIYSYNVSQVTHWYSPTVAHALTSSSSIFDDTYLQKGEPTQNQGSNSELWCHYVSSSVQNNCIVRYSVPYLGDITITDSTLYVYVTTSVDASDFVAYPMITKIWVEGQATWNVYSTGNNWVIAGGDYATTTPLGSFTAPASGWISVDVTGVATSSESQAEILIKRASSAYGYTAFASSDHGTVSYRPYIDITYTVNETTPSATTTATSTDAAANATMIGFAFIFFGAGFLSIYRLFY